MENETKFTKQDLINVYGDVEMSFAYYHKHSFLFNADYSQGKLSAIIDGDTYRLEVTNKPKKLKDLINDGVTAVMFYDLKGDLKNEISI